ncbi:MAG: response regulator [Myxococcaceae bacterium]|nr:response regulator [Myxococcaceae bacterium]
MAGAIRILIVDDSALTRETLRRTLELDPRMKVVGEAKTGEESIELVRSLSPDLVTMDLQMPGMGGLKAIEVIMRERPTPIVVISERSSAGVTDYNYEAISRGALELVPKSSVFGQGPDDVRRFAERIRRLAEEGLADERPAPASAPPPIPVTTEAPQLLGVGASTGGPRALSKFFTELPTDFPLPIVVVQHMAEDFFESFVRFLADSTRRRVVAGVPDMPLVPGSICVAPPRQELFVRENLTVKLLNTPPGQLISPSVDSLFFSMATALKGRGLGVLLTGMGDDGAQGLLRMRRMGARTAVQDRASCAVWGMPRAALEVGATDLALSVEKLAAWCAETARGVTPAVPRPAASSKRRRILVVDDDHASLEFTRTTLEGAGYEVHTLDNPMMVAATLRRTPADLVLLESELVTVAGIFVIEAMRKNGFGHVPLVLHSKLEGDKLKQRATECGVLGFLHKGDPGTVELVKGLIGAPTR